MRVVNIVLNNVLDDTRVLKTAGCAARAGHPCTILGFSKTRELERHTLDGVEVTLAPNVRWRMEAKEIWERDTEKRDLDAFVRETARLFCECLTEDGPILLHSHDMLGLGTGAHMIRILAERGIDTGWVHDLHEYTRGATNISPNVQTQAIAQHARWIREPDALLTVSPAIAEASVREDGLTEAPDVVYNAPRRRDARPAPDADIRTALGLAPEVPLVVYSGSIASPMRGVATLIEAMPAMPGVHVAIVTNREAAFEALRDKAGALGAADRLHVHGYVPTDAVSGFIATADIGCHPMLHFGNGEVAMPNKLFEYMHAGLPMLTSDVKSMAEFVTGHGIGEVFEAGNAADLAEKCRRILAAKDRYRAALTPDLLETYSWESQEPKIRAAYSLVAEFLDSDRARARAPRVVHGFTSAAGQPWAASRGLREIGVAADAVRLFREQTPAGYGADRVYDPDDKSGHLSTLARLALRYDIFHYYARPILKDRNHKVPFGLDMLLLRAAGKTVLFSFRGSEARLPSLFREKCPYHWLPERADDAERAAEADQRRTISLVSGMAHRVLVPDPEMASYVPGATILPRAVDLRDWPASPLPANDTAIVVHAPTSRVLKGTDDVERAVAELRDEGVAVELRLVEGMAQDAAREIYRSADVVVDQLRIGWYGVFSVEAMALGRPVLCYIREDLLPHLGTSPPLMPTTRERLKEDLRRLLADRALREDLGRRGRAYAERVHDSRAVARQLAGIYEACRTDGNALRIADIAKYLLKRPEAVSWLAGQRLSRRHGPGMARKEPSRELRRRRRRLRILGFAMVLSTAVGFAIGAWAI